mmetsp:Transcript_46130/g.98563  ORF Transcript_46130/g.98563 Transcript_46130/m.98563 type:complete len:223 (-) Transcript_46130:171-839(-)
MSLVAIHDDLKAHGEVFTLGRVLEPKREAFTTLKHEGGAEVVEGCSDILWLSALKNLLEFRERDRAGLLADHDVIVPKLPVKGASASSELAVDGEHIHLPTSHHSFHEGLHLRLYLRHLALVSGELVVDELAADAAANRARAPRAILLGARGAGGVATVQLVGARLLRKSERGRPVQALRPPGWGGAGGAARGGRSHFLQAPGRGLRARITELGGRCWRVQG